jgi:hypothetical protein
MARCPDKIPENIDYTAQGSAASARISRVRRL